MGLFNFLSTAGEKLLGKDEEAELAAEKAAEAREKLRKVKTVAALRNEISNLGLEVQGLDLGFDGTTVTVGGDTADHETREKVIVAIGNYHGIGAVDDRLTVGGQAPPAESAEAEAGTRFYTVVRGDTLSKIAKEQYGKANKYPVIFEANRPMLENPDRIFPGQVLRIPPLGE